MITRAWYIPQIPMKAFYGPLRDSYERAAEDLEIITDFSIFEFENNVKPDCADVGGVEYLDRDGDWAEWDPDFPEECAADAY